MFSTQKNLNISGFLEVIHVIHIVIPQKQRIKKWLKCVNEENGSRFTKNYATFPQISTGFCTFDGGKL